MLIGQVRLGFEMHEVGHFFVKCKQTTGSGDNNLSRRIECVDAGRLPGTTVREYTCARWRGGGNWNPFHNNRSDDVQGQEMFMLSGHSGLG